MYNPENFIEEQNQYSQENLRLAALALLDINDHLEKKNFTTAEQMLEKIEFGIMNTRVAVQGLRTLSS